MKNLLNKKYHLELTVLSPLHIGAGNEKDWAEGLDFVQKDSRVYRLDLDKVATDLGVDVLASLISKKDSKGIINKLPGSIEDYSSSVFEVSVSIRNDIKVFIKNGFSSKPFVPGSSIKGAIRSVLFSYLRDHQTNEKEIFGSPNTGDEFMRFIKVSDAPFCETRLINTKIFNLFNDGEEYKGGWKHSFRGDGSTNSKFTPYGFNTIYEVINPEESGNLTLSISEKAFSKINNHTFKEKKSAIIEGGIEKLFEIINSHTMLYLKKEIAFFEKYPNNESDKIISHLKDIINEIPESNDSCILKMGAGSGFHSITGDWQHEDYDKTGIWEKGPHRGKKKYKSRRIAFEKDSFNLMGFVKLRVKTDDEIEQEEKEFLELERKQKEEAEDSKRKKQEEEHQKKMEEKRLIEEKKAEEERQRKKEEERRKELEEIKIKSEKEEEERKRREEINLKKKQIEKEKLLEEGLDNKLKNVNDFETGKKIISDFKKVVEEIPDSEHDFIYHFIKRGYRPKEFSKKEIRQWQRKGKGHWGLIRSWVGIEKADKWFDEFEG